MARLVSVNVGLPRDIEWNGRTVHTAIWKEPVAGRCRAFRLNLEGDGQGDKAGHGGEQRAVFVYQLDSYRHWQERLKRSDFVPGQFGENFTIEGLPDSEACIGDRFQIGSALFEISAPRVTCYRIGIRMSEPRMAALLTSSGRPGFYFRVLREGDVGDGDEIVKVGEAAERMTVAEINALLYLPPHSRERLQHALRIDALSPGWRASFEALLQSEATGTTSGNAGLAPSAAAHPAPPGFRSLTVSALERESADVLSLTFRGAEGDPLPTALPGQYVVLRLRPTGSSIPIFRSYSLSGPISSERYRISVKIEPNGAAGRYLHDHVRVGDAVDVSAARGGFVLQPGTRPVVLLSAGIGVTPVLAMLHALSAQQSARQVSWIHGASDRQHHPFPAEVRGLLGTLPGSRHFICYSHPEHEDKLGEDYDAAGHVSRSVLAAFGVSPEAEVYLCGPTQFMVEMKEALIELGCAPSRVYREIFNGGESLTPGVVQAGTRAPHPPADDSGDGPLVSFARSGVAARFKASGYQSLLELAEACDVPVRWSCRSGVCHSCESGLVSGEVAYAPDPLDAPAAGNVLLCCARPTRDLVIDV